MFKREKNDDENEPDPLGLKRGRILLPLVFGIGVWFFTVPPEFRRARFCTEEQVVANPDSKCITMGDWVSNLKEYYSNGGGIQWDFSVDPDNN